MAENTENEVTEMENSVPENKTQEDSAGSKPKKSKKKSRKKKKSVIIKIIVILLILLIAAGAGYFFYQKKQAEKMMSEAKQISRTVTPVRRGEISNKMTSSGSLSPKDTYTITSLVEGEIKECYFDEGDEVKAGQILYVIDSKDVEQSILTAEKSLSQAQEDYEDAVSEYEKTEAKLSGGCVYSSQSGYLKNLKLAAGDTVSANTEIGEVFNNSSMTVRMPFLAAEADCLWEGQDIVVVIGDTGEQIPGRIISKSSLKETLTGGIVIKYIEIIVTNPGGLSESDTATAFTGDIYSVGDGYFQPYSTQKLRADVPTSVKVEKVLVKEGQYIGEGTALFTISEDAMEDALKSYKKSVNQAETSVENSKDKLDQLKENLGDYIITAPIDGKVIYRNAKAGDKITKAANSASSLAMIYDLSTLTFEMSIDELDISKIKTGLTVEVTADAFEGEVFLGTVTNVSLNGSYSNGVTTYPVVVTLNETGNLLPSMNVNGTIILEKSEDTLYISSDALNRGNIVYVENDSITDESKINKVENANAPEGFTAVKVETGLISDDYVEIVNGLSDGMNVYSKSSSSGNSFDMMGGFPMGDFPMGGSGGFPSGSGSGGFPSGGGSGGFPSGGGSGGGNRPSGGGMPGGF